MPPSSTSEQFGWANFRVLFVTTDQQRIGSMIDASRQSQASTAWRRAALFLFNTFADISAAADPLRMARPVARRKSPDAEIDLIGGMLCPASLDEAPASRTLMSSIRHSRERHVRAGRRQATP